MRWIQRYRARGRYFAAERAAGDAWAALSTATTPQERCAALYAMAEHASVMAQHAYGFRAAGDRDRDGFTLAQSCAREAWLAGMVARTEAALVSGNRALSGRQSAGAISPAATAILAQLRTEPRPAERGVLVLALRVGVIDQVGGQAAEVLCAIANAYFELSGMSPLDAMRRAWSPRSPMSGPGHDQAGER